MLQFVQSFTIFSPRLAFLILDTGHKGSSIALINAYAPTQDRIGKHPHEVDQFHRDLKQLYLNLSKKHFLVLMSGDLNAKLGLKQDKQESFMGQYGKGTRNHPGNLLANFLLEEDLFAANTAFKKSMRFRSTWSGRCKKDKEPLYNMIDYIIVPAKFKGILTDAQCYHGHVASSDHGIVVAKMDMSRFVAIVHQRSSKRNHQDKWNVVVLSQDAKTKQSFETAVSAKLDNSISPNIQSTIHALTEAGDDVVGKVAPIPGHWNTQQLVSKEITDLSNRQKELRLQIYHSPHNSPQRVAACRKERNECFKLIRKKLQIQHTQYVNHVMEEMETSNNQAACFRILRYICNTRKYRPLTLLGADV